MSRLQSLAHRAQNGPWQGLGDAWQAFAADLDADLTLREQRVAAHAHKGIAQREHAQRISREHAATRALVVEIGREIARREFRGAAFELLAEILEGCPPTDDNRDERAVHYSVHPRRR